MIKQYRKLRIDLDHDKFTNLQSKLTESIGGNWTYISVRELDFAKDGTSVSFAYRGGDLPDADLSVAWYDAHASIGNIVPQSFGQLTMDEYNALLMDFYNKHLAPAAKQLGINVHLTDDQRDILEWINPETKRKLDSFSSLANMGSGISHPNDRERWLEFIVAAHREKTTLPSGVLQRWLVSELGWPETSASDLASNYDNALELLEHYDSVQ